MKPWEQDWSAASKSTSSAPWDRDWGGSEKDAQPAYRPAQDSQAAGKAYEEKELAAKRLAYADQLGVPVEVVDAAIQKSQQQTSDFIAKNRGTLPKTFDPNAHLGSMLSINVEDAVTRHKLDNRGLGDTLKGMRLSDAPAALSKGMGSIASGIGALTDSKGMTEFGSALDEHYDYSNALKNDLSFSGAAIKQTGESLPAMAAGVGLGGLVAKGGQLALGATKLGANSTIAAEIAGAVGAKAPLLARAVNAAPLTAGLASGESGVSYLTGAGEGAAAFDAALKTSGPEAILQTPRGQELLREHGSAQGALAAMRDEAISGTARNQALGTAAGSLLFPGLDGRLIGKALRNESKIAGSTAVNKATHVLGETLQEFTQSGLESIGGNLAAKSTFDPKRDATEGSLVAASMGAVSGTITSGAVEAAGSVASGAKSALSAISFADPNGPASQAGITPVVVPTPQNVSTPSGPIPVVTGANAAPSNIVNPSVGDSGLAPSIDGRLAGDTSVVTGSNAGASTVLGASGEPSASVNPIRRTADKGLLSGLAYEDDVGAGAVQAQQSQSAQATDANRVVTPIVTPSTPEVGPINAAPESIWTGKSGSGYETQQQAQNILPIRAKEQPTLNWTVEQRQDGRYQLAGYGQVRQTVQPTYGAKNDTANNASQVRNADGPQGAGGTGVSGAGAAIAGGLPGVADTAGRVATPNGSQVVGDSAAARAKAQANLDYWHGRDPSTNPKITLGEPEPKADAQIQSAIQQSSRIFGTSAKVVAFSDPSPDSVNGIQIGDAVYINTKGLTSNALNTGWHETHHVMQAQSEADTRAGKTNTPAQRYVAKVDAIFDTMSEAGKRQYVEQFLYADRLKGLTGAERETAIQAALKSSETRNEMMADFVGNRATDRDFIKSLAKADPKNFQQWAKKWLDTINSLIADLRGNGGNKPSKAVDRYVANLTEAKATLRDAMVELKNSGTAGLEPTIVSASKGLPAYQRKDARDRDTAQPGINAEVAPDPRNKVGKARWDAMPSAHKDEITRELMDDVASKLLDNMGLKGWSVDYTSGMFEGQVNPSAYIKAPVGTTTQELGEVARALGYVFDQKGMVAFDENNTTSDSQAAFVEVVLPEGMSQARIDEIRKAVFAAVPQAEGDTLRAGSLVFGNFSAYNDKVQTLTDAEFMDAVYAVANSQPEQLDVVEPTRFHSEWIQPDFGDSYNYKARRGYLEGTRYASDTQSKEAGGDDLRGQAGGDVSRAFIERLAADTDRKYSNAVEDSITGRRDARASGYSGAGNTPIGKPERQYGSPRPGSVSEVGVHYSKARRANLSSQYHGSGLKGDERTRMEMPGAIKDRLYFYTDTGKGITPESGVGGSKHTVQLNNLYDIDKDASGYLRLASNKDPLVKTNNWERMVVKAGFDGWVTANKGGNQGFAVLLGKHNIEMPNFQRRFKSVDEFDSSASDFDGMNELGNFNVDVNDDAGFPDLSDADTKLDKQAAKQAELDATFRQRMVDKSKLRAGPAAVTVEQMQEKGLNPEQAFSLGEMTEQDGKIEFSAASGFPEAGDMYEVSEFATGWRVGTEHSFTMGNNWTKEGAIRQFRNLVTAPFIHRAGFDIASNYRKGTALKLAQTWRNLAGKHGTFKMPARSAKLDFAEVANEIGAIKDYDISVDGNNRKEITFTDKAGRNTFSASIAMMGSNHFKCCTMGLDGSKIGTEFYAVASEWARNNKLAFASDTTLSAVNGFRRTEQATSYALKTGDTGVTLPGVQNRVYGYNNKPETKEDHDMNLARLLIAGMRNAMEIDPEIRRLKYEPETGKFTDSKGDAEDKVKAFLANKDARAAGMGRSTLARAVLTSQIIAGGFDAGAVTKFAEPVAYSRKFGLDEPLSEGFGSDPSRDGAKTTFSPQFAKWFGDSKVVDANGNPLVVYHGTAPSWRSSTTPDVHEFNTDGHEHQSVAGAYFTKDVATADKYTKELGVKTGAIYPVFLSMKNPASRADYDAIKDKDFSLGGDAIREQLITKGFDGFIDDSMGEIVAFKPEQIKSVFNNGDFNPEDARISYARKLPVDAKLEQWANDVLDRKRGTSDTAVISQSLPHEAYSLGPSEAFGMRQPIVFGEDVLRHVQNRDHLKEGITTEMIGQLPEALKSPRMVTFQSPGQLLAMLPIKSADGKPVVVVLKKEVLKSGQQVLKVARMATTFPMDNSAAYVIAEIRKGNRVWLPLEEVSRLRELQAGVNSPSNQQADSSQTLALPASRSGNRAVKTFNVLSDAAIVKKQAGDKDWAKATEQVIISDDAEKQLRGVAFARKFKAAQGLPEETTVQGVQRVMQDQYNRVKLVQDLLVENGGLVGEEQDVYRAEERMHGRVHEIMRQFKDDVMQPFLDKAVAEKVDLNELALYAYAKHAKERNAHIQSFNNHVQTGSGMSDDTADNIIQLVDLSGDKAKFDDLHADMMGITATTRRVMLDDGLITQDQYDGLEAMYDNYVPLRGFEDVDADTGKMRPGLGRGFNVKGKETIAAMGRDSMAGDIIENIIRDYERVTIRTEKNSVGKTFLDLVQSNPDPKLWEIQPIKRAVRKDANGLVQYQNVEDKGEDTVAVKVGGQSVYIKIHDDLMLRAMQQTFKGEKSDSERMVMRVASAYTSLLRNTITRYNPVFGVINAVRDSQMGAMGVFDELGAEGLKLYTKNYGPAVMAGWRTEVNSSNPQAKQMDKWMREMRFAGGTTGGVFMRDNETIRGELRDAMLAAGVAPNGVLDWAKHNTGTRAVKHVLHGLEIIGAVSEHAARLSAYAAAREMGRTPAQAAAISKNLTVNFNRFGEQGQLINTLFLFYNAAVQGSVRIGQMAKNPKVLAAFAGMAGVGLALAMYGASAGGDDEDGQPYWDKIPDWEKERNFIIMLPPGVDQGEKVGKHGRYIKIPMAYGLNVFPALGYQIADVVRNQKDPTKGSSVGKAAINMVSAVMGSYNPFGGSLSSKPDATWALAIAPTMADPIIQLSQGVDGFGRSTGPAKSQYDQRPDSEIVSGTKHGKVEHRIARYLNEATGGNQAREGMIDLQPGTIKNMGGIVGGGLGKFVTDMVNLGYLGVQDLPIETRDIPVYKAFYGEYDRKAGMGQYYERSQKAMKEFDSMKNEMKIGAKRDYSLEDKFLQSMGAQAEAMSQALGDLKKWEVSIAEGAGTDKEKEIKRKEVQKVRERLAADYNKRWYSEESKLKTGTK